MNINDTIVALSTPGGVGAIGIIRLSGPHALTILQKVFQGIDPTQAQSHSLHFGRILSGTVIVDEVVLGVYRSPKTYTGEDVAEVSCHGSPYIIRSVLDLLVFHGCRLAGPGEFTLRAFLNGKLDLSQSEAVSDLIASENAASHQVAMQQLRGNFSTELKTIRQQLIDFASLIELELDFSEEDVEFANRDALTQLLIHLEASIKPLMDSFTLGNALKKGIPVVIAGRPNAGKSTLLNSLVNDERAIVSSLPGTTRDTIEVEWTLDGILFRLIDTAGLRETQDEIELLGIRKTYQEMHKASIVLYLFDRLEMDLPMLSQEVSQLQTRFPESKILLVANKSDLAPASFLVMPEGQPQALYDLTESVQPFSPPIVSISAKEKDNLDGLHKALLQLVDRDRLHSGAAIVTNVRHIEALQNTLEAIGRTFQLLKGEESGELLAFEIKQALYHLGTITGEVSTDDLLANIFSRFCIGK